MSCFQAAAAYRPHGGLMVDMPVAGLGRTCKLLPLARRSLCSYASGSHRLQQQLYPRLVLVASSHRRLAPVYASSGKGSSEIGDDPFSMESLKKAMAGAKKQPTIQELLKEQMAKLGQGSGGDGGNRNYRGGGGSGGPEDESFKEMLDEVVQVILATIAFILVYIHIIRGEELYRLARDYTRYLVTGRSTARLRRAMHKWHDFSNSIVKRDHAQEDWYERPVASKTAWWQQPQKFAHLMQELCRGYLRQHAQES